MTPADLSAMLYHEFITVEPLPGYDSLCADQELIIPAGSRVEVTDTYFNPPDSREWAHARVAIRTTDFMLEGDGIHPDALKPQNA